MIYTREIFEYLSGVVFRGRLRSNGNVAIKREQRLLAGLIMGIMGVMGD